MDSSNVDESNVVDLITRRSNAKKDRDFDTADAIRDKLRSDFDVAVDDREQTWRTGASRSGSGRGNFRGGGRGGRGSPYRGGRDRRPRQDFGPNGHDYELSQDAGPNASGLSDGEIHGMIAERLMAKLGRDFSTADAIQSDLVARGVFVHDGNKEWRSDGVAYGDLSERRRGGYRGNPGRSAGSRSSYDAPYAKSSYSADVEGIDEKVVAKLVEERRARKMNRMYDEADAIREGLRDKYNVLIDDRLKMWSVAGDFGEEYNAQRDMAHKFANRGYIKSASSISLSPEDEALVGEQLRERFEAKRNRDFDTADAIRDDLLLNFDVSINDKMKLWSVGGAFEETGGRTRSPRGVYTRRGGGNLTEETVEEIKNALMERYNYKKSGDFDQADAIREDLQNRFDVRIDDRSNEWRIETDEYFPASTGSLSEDTIESINEKLRERFHFKQDRDYDSADAIREELGETYGVVVDDRTKEWKVEDAVEEPPQEPQRFESANFDRDPDTALGGEEEEGEDVADDNESVELASEEIEDEDEEEDEDNEFNEASLLTEEELSKFTIPILKEKLRDAGLPVSGKKSELVARLLSQ